MALEEVTTPESPAMTTVEVETAQEARDELAQRLRRLRFHALKPAPRLNVVQWADKYRRLAPESGAIGGRWQTSRVEIARGPMMAVTEPGVRVITMMSCTQLLKSSLLENIFGFHAHLDPSPMLLVQPKDEAAEKFSIERIAPMVRATPVLRAIVGDGRTRISENKIKFKSFPGGFLALEGAGSPTNLAMRPIRISLADEIDKYEPNKEGDPVALAEERLATFTSRALAVRACSPTLEETSRIGQSYAQGDQRRAYVMCPHCQHEQVLDFFRHVHWTKTEDGEHFPETAAVVCEECGVAWSEPNRLQAIGPGHLKWRQTKPFLCCGERQNPQDTKLWRWDEQHQVGRAVCKQCGKDAVSNRHASFHASKLHSPWEDMATLADKWLKAKDDPELRQTFFNTQLGLPAKFLQVAEVSSDELLSRRESWADAVPDGVLVLAAGVDVQSAEPGRFEIEVVGYGLGEESWSVAYEVIEGDLKKQEAWDRLDAYLLKTFQRTDGSKLRIAAACIDSGGHHTQAVYNFSKARLGRRVWAIKGAAERGGQRQPVWPQSRITPKWRQKFRPVIIGVNAAKDSINRRLALAEPGPGYCHFPQGRDAGYFTQLTSEKLIYEKRAGSRVAVWKLQKGRANEALDARVYAYAAFCGLVHHGLSLDKLQDARVRNAAPPPPARMPPLQAVTVNGAEESDQPPTPPAAPPPQFRKRRRVVRSSYMNR